MLNQTVLVGRLSKLHPKNNMFILLCQRLDGKGPVTDSDGDYIVDSIPIKVAPTVFESIVKHAIEGDLIGVKGFVSAHTVSTVVIFGVKISLLSRKEAKDLE